MTRRSDTSGSSEAEVLGGMLSQLTKKGAEMKKALARGSTFVGNGEVEWWVCSERRKRRTAEGKVK